MRRRTIVGVVSLVMALALPASAFDEVCGDIFGIARLKASGAGAAQGSALVWFDGSAQLAEISSQVTGPDTTSQTWELAQGTVDVVEHTMPGLLPGPWQTIDSTVDVQSPNSGTWEYHGTFHEGALVARFVVTGDLCVGG